MEEITKTFKAFSEDGQEFIIHEYTNFIKSGTFENPNRVTPGMKELRTSNGDKVNRLDKGKYEIVSTALVVTSDSPDAI
ncbi:MAG: hypothetical protein V3V72_02290 [Ignavibacteriaceae bacterium]|jgi:hypothetical protein